jgi:PAS domain S-box-containing protein
MLGFSEEELRGKHCVQFSPPEDAEKDWVLFQQLRAGSIDHYQLEKRYFRRDGSLVWGRLSISLLNSRPSPLVIAMVEDITDKRTAEEAVRASEERLRLAQQAARIGSFEWNVQTGVNTWTPELEAMYGLQPGGFSQTQTAFENLVHADDRAGVIKLVDRALKTGQPTEGEWRAVWPDGSVHWIAGRWQVLMNESREPVRMIGVNIDVTQRKQTEEGLRKSEERFRLAAQAGKMFAYEWDAATDRIVRSDGVAQILGVDEGAHTTGQQILTMVPPEDRERLIAAIAQLSPEEPHLRISYRMVRSDGTVIWVDRTSRAYFDEQGRMLRIVGMLVDITERKLAEAALANVSRQLIEAQEQERTRIGRELHDDIGQRLAMLAIALEQLQQESLALPAEVRNHVGELQKQTSEIAADLQTMSHQLHSAKLQYLGIAAAMRGFCQEFGEQQKVEIDFQTHDLPSPVPPDTALCLFRVLQEALHNSVKHSGVRHIEVRLWGTSGEIQLTVKDSGAGFDREAAKEIRGLGLISMEERLKLVNGTLSVDSQPNRGTTIHARVPLGSAGDFMRAAG